MKILHLLASPFFTGPAETITQLALAQRAQGHEVTIAVDRKRTMTTSEELITPRLESLDLLSPLPLELSVKSSPMRMLRDVRELHRADVDVIHSHFSHDHSIARLGKPKRAILIRSLHAPRSVRWSLPKANGYTVPMDAMARMLLGKRVLVLPPLVSSEFTPAVDRATLKSSLGLPAKRLIGMVSTFQKSRRHALALEAFAALHAKDANTHLVLIGDGPLEAQLKQRALALGDAVTFTGYQSGTAFTRSLQALDDVWILGLGNDWSARAAAQARACDVRVLAVDEGALSRFADVLVEPSVSSILESASSTSRALVTLETIQSIAERVTAFYKPTPRAVIGVI